jgi:hypothetical protein
MPSLLKHNPCPACGRRHDFCLPDGDLSDCRAYTFVCPKTGRAATLAPEVTAEIVRHTPPGAVHLTPVRSLTKSHI